MTDIEKWESLLATAKELAGGEVTAEVTALETKVETLKAEALAAVDEGEAKVTTWAENFRSKHGISVYVAGVAIAFVVFQVFRAIH